MLNISLTDEELLYMTMAILQAVKAATKLKTSDLRHNEIIDQNIKGMEAVLERLHK